MSDYRAAAGTNVVLGGLGVIDPQPRSEGIKVARRTHSAAGTVFEEGLYIELEWNVLSIFDFNVVMGYFSLVQNTSAWVTVYIPDWNYDDYTRYNGVAIRPEIGRDAARKDFFIRDVVILVRDLTLAT